MAPKLKLAVASVAHATPHNVHFSNCAVTVRPANIQPDQRLSAFKFCPGLLVNFVCSCSNWWLEI